MPIVPTEKELKKKSSNNGHNPSPPSSSTSQQTTHNVSSAKLLILNNLLNRYTLASRLGKTHENERELYKVLGYKSTLDYDDYLAKYKRQDVASRIVDLPAQATWKNVSALLEEKDNDKETQFEKKWVQLNLRLKTIHYLERADKLAGIGKYSVLLVGLPGALHTKVKEKAIKGPDDVLYFSVYSEKHAKVSSIDTSPSSTRFGLPEMYELTISESKGLSPAVTKEVHYSRVVHVAEGKLEDEVEGTPRLESIFNRLEDVEKVAGGSGEMFWQGAYRGLHLDVRDSAMGDLGDEELADLSEEIDEYIHGLRRIIRTQGVDLKALDVELGNPRPTFQVLIDLIVGAKGIPKTILFGSESGERASTQDVANWVMQIAERRADYAEPVVLRPLVDILIRAGALPNPRKGYKVTWPNIYELTQLQQAQVAESVARTVRFISGKNALKEDMIITENEMRGTLASLLGIPAIKPPLKTNEGSGELENQDDPNTTEDIEVEAN